MTGTAEKDNEIELFDNGEFIGRRDVGSSGHWQRPAIGLVLGPYSLIAKTKDGTGRESDPWRFTVDV